LTFSILLTILVFRVFFIPTFILVQLTNPGFRLVTFLRILLLFQPLTSMVIPSFSEPIFVLAFSLARKRFSLDLHFLVLMRIISLVFLIQMIIIQICLSLVELPMVIVHSHPMNSMVHLVVVLMLIFSLLTIRLPLFPILFVLHVVFILLIHIIFVFVLLPVPVLLPNTRPSLFLLTSLLIVLGVVLIILNVWFALKVLKTLMVMQSFALMAKLFIQRVTSLPPHIIHMGVIQPVIFQRFLLLQLTTLTTVGMTPLQQTVPPSFVTI